MNRGNVQQQINKMERRIAKARRRLTRHVQHCMCERCSTERATINRLDNLCWLYRNNGLDESLQTGDYERHMRD